jgi:hypothetical protein
MTEQKSDVVGMRVMPRVRKAGGVLTPVVLDVCVFIRRKSKEVRYDNQISKVRDVGRPTRIPLSLGGGTGCSSSSVYRLRAISTLMAS